MRTVSSDKWHVSLKTSSVPMLEAQMWKKNRMSTEKIFRKSFTQTCRELTENTSLSVIRNVIDKSKSKFERLLWFLITLYILIYIIQATIFFILTFHHSPLKLTQMTGSVPANASPFPVVALCNINNIRLIKTQEWAQKLSEMYPKAYSYSHSLMSQVKKYGALIDFSVDETLVAFAELLLELRNYTAINVRNLMLDLSPRCSDMLLRCYFAGTERNCSEMFKEDTTYRGYCCIFNLNKVYNERGEAVGFDEAPETLPLIGADYGLSVVIDPQVEDYAYTNINSEGVQVLIYHQLDQPYTSSGSLIISNIPPNNFAFLELKKTFIYSTDAVKTVPRFIRKCNFPEEHEEIFHGVYSQTECLAQCRASFIEILCKCIPFQLSSPSSTVPHCKLADIACLNKFREMTMFIHPAAFEPEISQSGLEQEFEDSLFCPLCYPDCNKERYSVTTYKVPINSEGKTNRLTKGINMTGKSVINIFYPDFATTVFIQDVIYSTATVVAILGGVMSFITGFSLIFIAELFYYFTFRLIARYNENKAKYS